MKKIIAFILTLAMLCTLLAACGGPEPSQDAASPQNSPGDAGISDQASPEDLDEITHKLLADWYGYLIRCEYLYGDILWALSYLDPFFEDHSWNSLQIARAAMVAAKRRAKTVAAEPLEAQMTFDDYDRLAQSGADVSVVSLVVDSVQSLSDDVFLSYRNYQSSLNSPVDAFFLTYELANFEDWAHLEKQIYNIYLHDCAVETDYLLLFLESSEEKNRFVEYIAENCPQINAWRQENPQSQDELEKLSSELLNELESLSHEMSSVLGQSQASLELFRDASEFDGTDSLSSYVSTIAADAVDLKDFPIALPYPDWWYETDNEAFKYFWDTPKYGEDGSRKFVVPGDMIDSPPDQYIAEWANVSLEDYLAYVENAEKRYNIPSLYTTEKEGRYTTYYEFKTASFALIWEENETSLYLLDGSVFFAPPWYIYYTRLIDS